MTLVDLPEGILSEMSVLEPIDLEGVGALTTELTAEYLEYYAVIPLVLNDSKVVVGTWRDERDLDPQALDDLRLIFKRDVEFVRCPENDLLPVIRRAYGIDPHTAQEMIAGLSPDISPPATREIALDDLVHLANEAPVVKLVTSLFWKLSKHGHPMYTSRHIRMDFGFDTGSTAFFRKRLRRRRTSPRR